VATKADWEIVNNVMLYLANKKGYAIDMLFDDFAQDYKDKYLNMKHSDDIWFSLDKERKEKLVQLAMDHYS